MKAVLRALMAGSVLGLGGTLTWLVGVWVYAEWERRHGLREHQRPYLFDTIEAAPLRRV